MEKKSFERPKTGVFYLIPDLSSGKYTIYADFDLNSDNEETEYIGESKHLFVWDTVIKILGRRFRGKFVEGLESNYMGLPRGRIMEGDGEWIVAWGENFPLKEYESEIVSEFRLGDAKAMGKVKWEVNEHEKMQIRDKNAVERTLGISMTQTGFKKKKTNSEKVIADVIRRR